MTITNDTAAVRLRSFVQRIERLEEEIAGLNADKKDVYAEAKGTGFDVKVMKSLVAERRKDQSELAEHNDLLDLYRRAMDPGSDVQSSRAGAPVRTRETNFDPSTGEITETTPAPPDCARAGHTTALGSTQSCGSTEGSAVRTESTLAGKLHAYPAAEAAEQGTTVRAESNDERVVASQPVVEPGPQDIHSELSHGVSEPSGELVDAAIKVAGEQAAELVAEADSVAPAPSLPGDDHVTAATTHTPASQVDRAQASTAPVSSKAPGNDLPKQMRGAPLVTLTNIPAQFRRDPNAAHWEKEGGTA